MEWRSTYRKAIRIDRLAGFRVESLGHSKLFELSNREIQRIVTPICAFALRKARRNVRGRIQVNVVQHHRNIVFRQHDILFEEFRSLRVRHRLRRQRVFRQVAAGPAMGDDNGRGLPAQKRQEEGKIEKNMFHSGVEFLVGL